MYHNFIVFTALVIFANFSMASSIEVMSYNVENLFDTKHDEGHSDYEYLPKSDPSKAPGCSSIENDYFRGKCFGTDWTEKIYKQKLNAIAEVVFRDGRQTPDILGLVEVENIKAANMLKSRLGYTKAIITRGSDQRGINVGLLFRESRALRYIDHEEIHVSTPGMRKPTRNILLVTFDLGMKGTLHVFVNHWPSQNNPSDDRASVAKSLVERMEKIKSQSNQESHFIVIGDFNVTPSDRPHAINDVLLSRSGGLIDVERAFRADSSIPRDLKNSMPPSSYYYKRGGNWNHLDRIFVGENLLDGEKVEVDLVTFEIFAHGKYSRRTRGQTVPLRFEINHGKASGVSDHYPISVKVKL